MHNKKALAADFSEEKILKTCPKCFTRHSRSEWQSLPLLGAEEGDEGWRVEFRVCECNATLSMALREQPSESDLHFYGEAHP